MTHRERRDRQMPYIADESVFEEMIRARHLLSRLNTMDRCDFEGIRQVIRELLQTEEDPIINPPFYCDYGNHIDVGKVTFGDNCFLAPNVAIYTAGHPIHPDARNSMYEYGIDVTIGHNVWIGGNAVICPGVTIGDNCVIGAGSVVTKDVPAWSIAAGNPARVIRKITEEDKQYYFKDRKFDPESWAEINR